MHGWWQAFAGGGAAQAGHNLVTPSQCLEQSLAAPHTSVSHRFMGQDTALNLAFGEFYQDMLKQVSEVKEIGEMARSEAQCAMDKFHEYEKELEEVICPAICRRTIPGPHLSMETTGRSLTPPATLKWSALPPENQQES